MIDEKMEYALSQYLDGTLPEGERPGVELLLRENAEARETLAQYRRLGTLVAAGTGPLPEMDWDALANQISTAVSHEEMAPFSVAATETAPARVAPIHWYTAPRAWLVAASLLLACGIAWMALKPSAPAPLAKSNPPADQTTIAVAQATQMQVLQPAEMVKGPAVTEIAIGPAPAAEAVAVWQLHPELLQDQASSVSIAGAVAVTQRDDLY